MVRSTRTALARRRQRVRTAIARVNNGLVRLSVYKSARHIYIQAIDDSQSRTVASASTLEPAFREEKHETAVIAAQTVGARLAMRLQEQKITRAVFDRGGYPFKGRVRHLAEAIREGGVAC